MTTAGKLRFYCTWEFVSHTKEEMQIMRSNAICNQEIYNTNNVNTLNYVSSLHHSSEAQHARLNISHLIYIHCP